MRMPGITMYWLKDPDAPFATFLSIVQTYYHPEVRNENFAALPRRARENRSDDDDMTTFKQEFVRLLQGDREGLHPRALSVAAAYDDWDTDDEFLVWLWHELYPDDPLPT